MKKLLILSIAALSMSLVACNGKKAADSQTDNAASDTTAVVPDSAAQQQQDTAFAALLKGNEGKTALDAKLLENETFIARVKSLAGAQYDSIVANFNTQAPIVSENGVYKLSGGRAHSVPAFNTTIVYDSQNDNLNIMIEKSGETTVLKEKDEIKMTDALKSK